MVALVIIALTAGALGAIAWAVDKYRYTFGAVLPAGAAVVAALLVWIITMAAGLDGSSATAWIPWILSMAVGGAAAWATAGFVGRTRHNRQIDRTTQILQIH
ncbi:hypothetical protein JOF48_002397 [Arthrobacter stackebrandtii]|uniref:Uncharacterized protein n=1 Tax=Arthrobacter stackebrandtii TaxID=272161 RepID=A0ABS4YXU1_9MICC|nr:hypothetical protein [Arthrobacter stackebrandtii]MBP2413598.1 hypothetical protein [Arthrobacter stackebrandtii]PYH00580.1 hypothetical protein CVV67_08575 [Arthrobacter stackebrandtii]